MENYQGTVEDIIYTNEMNGYTVCDVRCGEEMVTCVGYMPFINTGETIKISGRWVTHPDYGEQLKVEMYEKVMPETPEAIEKYLGSGIIKGVGPATAARIVEAFGKDTLDIIHFKPQMLAGIKGISLDKAIRIGQAFEEQKGLRNVVMFLQEYGISPSCSAKIYKAFGERTVEKIRENPYCLNEEAFGIGFKVIDRLAMKIGIDPCSKYRICSGIKYVLSQAAASGHTYIPGDKLGAYTSQLLQNDLGSIEDAVVSMVLERDICVEKIGEESRVYLNAFHQAELGVCRGLAGLASACFKVDMAELESDIDEIQVQEGLQLAELQRIAITEAITNGVLVITGGPGTGKTTIIKSIIKLLQKNGHTIALAAPTGRAAKRMSEATGFEAKTIHRLLEMGYMSEGTDLVFQRNNTNPIEADAVIIDEMSMMDILLMHHLIKAMPAGARLILVGDVNQLPSVGAGNVLSDIISSGFCKTVRLTEIFRQAQESMIIVNAHRINSGEMPFLNAKGKDFYFMQRNSAESLVSTIVDLCSRRLPESYNYDPIRQIQVLTPTRKGPSGVVNLNQELQKVLNPWSRKKGEKVSGSNLFREGDKVMQVKNNYNVKWIKADNPKIEGTGIFNGDAGIIHKIDDEEQYLEVIFEDDKIVHYDYSMLSDIDAAFAVTVHKSQGSEFPVVVIPVFPGPQVLMTRNLLYTAVTRARELVVVVGMENTLAGMVENVRETMRFSGLEDKLKNCILNADI